MKTLGLTASRVSFSTMWDAFVYMLESSHVSLIGTLILVMASVFFVPPILSRKKKIIVGILHVLAHLTVAMILMLFLELSIEICFRNRLLATSDYHALCEWYRSMEREHFPDPTGLRARIEQWTFGFYPACIKPVTTVAWSPDDKQLLTCGLLENVRRWDVHTGNCLHIYGKSGLGLISCGWFPDGEHFFTGVSDKTIWVWDLDGEELKCWKGQRTTKTSDMAVTKDGKLIIILCRETAILFLDKEGKLEQLIEEEQIITSFSLSKDDKYLLVNLINQEIHLWSILVNPELVIKYRGHKRNRFLINTYTTRKQGIVMMIGSLWRRGCCIVIFLFFLVMLQIHCQ